MLVKQVAKTIAHLIDHPLRPQYRDEEELLDKFRWILGFYWVAFNDKKSVSKRRAVDCADSLVFIGLLFFSREHPEVLRASISNIRSILESYCEIAKPPDFYTIGDMLAHLWAIRLLLVARKNAPLIQEVDKAIATRPAALTDEECQAAQNAIGRRRQQLEERLAERDDRLQRPDTAEALLRKLVREAQVGAG